MHIRSLELHKFTTYDTTKVEFPSRGIVLVYGDNGQGKSSIPEAVSVALWGSTLRKKRGRKKLSLFRSKKGYVAVSTDKAYARRTATGKLLWSTGDDLANVETFETRTKSQQSLNLVVGEPALWAKSRVFSSADASLFTGATDSERKRLLEAVLRLSCFDSAYDKCKADMRDLRNQIINMESSISVLKERASGLQARIDELPRVSDFQEIVVEGVRVARSTYKDVAAQLRERLIALRGARKEEARLLQLVQKEKLAHQRTKIALANARKAVDDDTGRCHTCGGKVPLQRVQELREQCMHAVEAEGAARLKMESAENQLIAARRIIKERSGSEDLEAVLERVVGWGRAFEQGRKIRALAKANLRQTRRDMREARKNLRVAMAQEEVLRAASVALSLQGIRAQMLGGALEGIELVTNAWLSRLSTAGEREISISLEPYSETGSGVKDAISLVVHGVAESEESAGKGQDYGLISGGERRRIDIALLLALAELEAGSAGEDPGTMFFDEVFDWLDESGRDAVMEILLDLAKRACVVVITHNAQLIAGLASEAAAVWQVKGGKIHEQRRSTRSAARTAD